MEANLSQLSRLEQEAVDEGTSGDRLRELANISTKLARLVASNSSAPPELLQNLVNTKDIFTLQNIAANLNTPPEVLGKLADARLENMIEDWKELRIPSPFGNGQPKFEEYFDKLKKRGVLQLTINTIKEVCKVYQLVAKNPNTPTDTLLMVGILLPTDFIQNPILSLLILENPNFIDKNYNTQIAIACHPETPVNLLKYLMEYGRPGVLQYIAQNPNTPVEFLEKMAEEAITKAITLDETPEGIAKNPKTPVHILEKLAVYMNNMKIDPIWFTENSEECQFNLAIALANHPNTSAYIWEQLVSSKNPSIRTYLVKYHNLPVTLLERLAKDRNKYVRLAIAEKTTNPDHIIRQLAQDKDRQVKEAVVTNSSTPLLLIDELAKGNDSQIRALASVEYNKRIREQYKSRNFKQWW